MQTYIYMCVSVRAHVSISPYRAPYLNICGVCLFIDTLTSIQGSGSYVRQKIRRKKYQEQMPRNFDKKNYRQKKKRQKTKNPRKSQRINGKRKKKCS